MNNATIIILGITGNLTRKKLIPAVYNLIKNKQLDQFALVGVARNPQDILKILESDKEHIENLDKEIWNKLKEASYYQQLHFNKKEDYVSLNNFLAIIEQKHGLSGNRLFYLATFPEHFEVITRNLAESKLAYENKGNWARIVYEKPFGTDLASTRKINRSINKVFDEKQVYRIDHYLGKEMVSNIALIRFTNRVLESQWNHKDIESVQIIISENFGIEQRGEFYERSGVVIDIIQNHALQLLALTAMEAPRKLDGDYIRSEKAKVLKKTVITDFILGQYEGYRAENYVSAKSETPTFIALKAKINNKRWKNVPFFIKSGKYLDRKDTSIHLKFKKVKCLLPDNCTSDANYFTIRIQPNEGFSLELNSKLPGEKNVVVPVNMNFTQNSKFNSYTPEAYVNLLGDVLKGDQSFFVRNDEIEYAWNVVEKILSKNHKVYQYRQGSDGPSKFKKWSEKHELRWKV